jgi:hypothetical protein
MAAPLVPIIIGGRVLMMAAPRAVEILRAGVGRALPRMRDIGGQSAGPNAAGPFYGRFATNAPTPRPGPWSPAVSAGVIGSGAGAYLLSRDGDEGGPAAEPRPLTVQQRSVPADINYDRPGLPDDALGGWERPSAPAPAASRSPSFAGAPMPPPRPAPEPPRERGDYQSMNALADGPERFAPARVIQGDRINWGDNERASDFFRADRALMEMNRAGGGRVDLMQMANEALRAQMARRQAEEGMKHQQRAMASGGRADPAPDAAPAGSDKVLEHALALIRHLISRG